MKWLEHVHRMDDNRQPKRLLLGELVKARPFCDAKQRCRDILNADSIYYYI